MGRPSNRPTLGPDGVEGGGRPEPGPGPENLGQVLSRPARRGLLGSKRLQADRYASDFKKLADEVRGPPWATPRRDVSMVTIEIEAAA